MDENKLIWISRKYMRWLTSTRCCARRNSALAPVPSTRLWSDTPARRCASRVEYRCVCPTRKSRCLSMTSFLRALVTICCLYCTTRSALRQNCMHCMKHETIYRNSFLKVPMKPLYGARSVLCNCSNKTSCRHARSHHHCCGYTSQAT